MGLIGPAAHAAGHAVREASEARRTVDYYMNRGRAAAGLPPAGAEQAAETTREGTVATRTGTVERPSAGTVARREQPPIPGDQLLDLIRDKWLARYARFPSPAALDAVTLWAAHVHMRDETGTLVFRATPRLYLLSNDPGSGKGRVLEELGMISPACYGLDLEATKAGLVHSLNQERATVLLDEGDILFGAGKRKSDVRAVINGGTYRHGTVLMGTGAKATRVPVFGAIAVAGLDVMEKQAGEALKALLTRGVKIRMQKAAGKDKPPKFPADAEEQGAMIRQWLTVWAAQVRDQVKACQPEMPEELDGRTEDIWIPLIAVAEAAGGDWPERAYAACSELAMAIPAPPLDEDEPDQAEEFAAFAAAFGADGPAAEEVAAYVHDNPWAALNYEEDETP